MLSASPHQYCGNMGIGADYEGRAKSDRPSALEVSMVRFTSNVKTSALQTVHRFTGRLEAPHNRDRSCLTGNTDSGEADTLEGRL